RLRPTLVLGRDRCLLEGASRLDERDAAELGEHAGAAPGRIVGGELLPEMPQPGQHVPGDDHLEHLRRVEALGDQLGVDRKSTRLNSSHVSNSYAVFCLKKKKI